MKTYKLVLNHVQATAVLFDYQTSTGGYDKIYKNFSWDGLLNIILLVKRDGAIHFLADCDLNFLFVIVIFKNDEQFFFFFCNLWMQCWI